MIDEKKLLETALSNLDKNNDKHREKGFAAFNEPASLDMHLNPENHPTITLEQIRDYVAKTDLPAWEMNYLRDEINRILNTFKDPMVDQNETPPNTEKKQTPDIRSYNIGDSDYSKHKIQPWDIWEDYKLNPWDADIVKRTLRTKQEPGMSMEESRILDYRKIIHVAQERIRQIQTNGHV